MALQQEDGWPLGLRPVNARIGMVRNRDQFNGSISFTTLLTASPTCTTTDSSSDLDTQSTGSFFHDKSITLGSLIGVSSILELSRRSTRRRTTAEETLRDDDKNCKSRSWLFSLCSRLSTDAVNTQQRSAPSLAHFLQAERRVRNTPNFDLYGPNDFSPAVPLSSHLNPLFIDDEIAPQARRDLGFDSH